MIARSAISTLNLNVTLDGRQPEIRTAQGQFTATCFDQSTLSANVYGKLCYVGFHSNSIHIGLGNPRTWRFTSTVDLGCVGLSCKCMLMHRVLVLKSAIGGTWRARLE
jgi:hypothetical protein